MKKFVPILLIFVLVFTLSGCHEKTKTVDKEQISGTEARAFMEEDNTILVDVRTDTEYDEDHIEGAISIPVDTPKVMIERMLTDKDERIIVYCRSGNRSSSFKKTLETMGYTNVYDLGAKDNWNQ